MNLIACSKPCVHQDEGYCRLEQPAAVSDCKSPDCMYFVDKQKDALPGGRRKIDTPAGREIGSMPPIDVHIPAMPEPEVQGQGFPGVSPSGGTPLQMLH